MSTGALHAPSAALLDELEPVHARQDDVDDQRVVNAFGDEFQRALG